MRLAALAVALSVLMANRSFANRIVVRAPNCAAKSTAVVQRAIDEASESGGGEVVLSGGTFLCGSLYLKSNVSLTIAADAVLKASPDRADYNAADVCPQNWTSEAESNSGAHLLLCIGQTNVAVRGEGRIDGNAPAFLLGPDGKPWPGGSRGIPWRPGQMLYFVESQDVRVEGLTLENAPYWSCFFHGCNAVRLGVGNGEVRDASLRNLVIRGTRTAVSAVGSWKRGERGCDIRHVVFEDLDIESRNFCHIYYKFATGSVFEDIAFRRVRGKVSGASVIEDTPERPFRNLVFERIMLAGETSPIASGQQHEVGKPPSPAALP